jgi:hypothetical protein
MTEWRETWIVPKNGGKVEGLVGNRRCERERMRRAWKAGGNNNSEAKKLGAKQRK